MNEIPIFDSLTHPMPDGGWINDKYTGKDKNHVSNLLLSMKKNNIQWALAVGLGEGIGGYCEDEYSSHIQSQSEKLFPVAFFDFKFLENGISIPDYLYRIKKLGYIGIKLHPRISRIDLSNKYLPEIIKEANNINLSVLLCTYFWGMNKGSCRNNLTDLHALLCHIPNEKIILLHGGAVNLLEVSEMVRCFKHVLLDLSFTLIKYEGSSIDLDIRYLFNKFDRRICVGSDSPEFSQSVLRRRFEEFSSGLCAEKKSNIAHMNLASHLGISL